MQSRDIVVIGASAGGIEAVSKVLSYLPEDLPAALFVVVHISPLRTSVLPEILTRKGKLPAEHPEHGQLIKHGHVYVAPPGYHMTITGDQILLSARAKENGHRPAVDPLFRSAARTFGPRVVGVILSGTLDDGTAGCTAISRCGGLTIAQDPEEAAFDGMPLSAIRNDDVEKVLSLEGIAEEITRLATTPMIQEEVQVTDEVKNLTREQEMEILTVVDQGDSHTEVEPGAVASVFTCPECSGTLFQTRESSLHFRCRVGHAYSPDSLLAEQTGSVEAALWTAIRTLEESANLSERLAERARADGRVRSERQFREHQENTEQHSRTLRNLLISDRLQTIPAEQAVYSAQNGRIEIK